MMETHNLSGRGLLRGLLALGAAIGVSATQAAAMPIDYDLAQIQLNTLVATPTGGLALVPDGTFEGSFTYDNDTRTFSSLAFTVAGTSFPSLNGFYETFEGFSFTNNLSVSNAAASPNTTRLQVDFGFPGPLTDPATFPPGLFDVTASIRVGFCEATLFGPCAAVSAPLVSDLAVATVQPGDSSVVPLPATLPLLGGALAALLLAARRARLRPSAVC